MGEARNWQESQVRVSVKNTSGEEIPAYACLELAFNYESGKSASFKEGREIVFDVKKPTSSGVEKPGILLFNLQHPIPIGGRGSATVLPFLQVMFDDTDGAISPGDTVGAKAASWYLTAAGEGFICKSFDSGNASYISASIRTIFITPSGGGGGGGDIAYYKLLEDMVSQSALAQRCNKAGVIDSGAPVVTVHGWNLLRKPITLLEPLAGYVAQYALIDGDLDFTQGPCFGACEHEGSLTVGDPDDGIVGESYSHSITGSGLVDGDYSTVGFSGLPPGLSATLETISGTPTTAGTYYVVVTADSPDTSVGADPEDVCTITKVLIITIVEA